MIALLVFMRLAFEHSHIVELVSALVGKIARYERSKSAFGVNKQVANEIASLYSKLRKFHLTLHHDKINLMVQHEKVC